MLIIFDRYNHTGAGVIYQVYSAGKYFVAVQGLGPHHDQVEKVIRIKAQKNARMNISLADSEECSKEKVVIPASNVKFGEMSILRTK